jgi:putative addiction module component (TIGR02574 family)
MTETAERLKSELSQLSTADRAEIAHFLLASLDEGIDADIDVAWEDELNRRMDEIEKGSAGEPVDQVIASLRAKYS